VRGTLFAAAVVIVCWFGTPSPAAAQQATDPLRDLVSVGAPLVASAEMPSNGSAATAAASPVLPGPSDPAMTAAETLPESGASPDPQLPGPDIPNPLDLFSALDPREWASAVLDTVVDLIGGAI